MGELPTQPNVCAQARWPRWLAAGLLALVLAGWVGDFAIDVHQRDALSWMDETQYFRHAMELAADASALGQFELPSVFPLVMWPILEIESSIAGALWINVLAVVMLVASLGMLRRALAMRTGTWVLAVVGLGTPLVLGLSRSLYVEMTLGAVVGMSCALWIATDHFRRPLMCVALGVMVVLGLLLKMTYPMFLIGPVAVELWWLVRQKQWGGVVKLIGVGGMAFVLAAGLQLTVFSLSLDYYLSLGNTQIPLMNLIGPRDVLSFESIVYYPWVLLRWGVLLVAAVWLAALIAGRAQDDRAEGRNFPWVAWLLAAVIVPVVVLTAVAVKEPRHIAPVMVPMAVLVGLSLDRLRRPNWWWAGQISVVAMALGGYVLSATGRLETPYLLDRPLGIDRAVALMRQADPEALRFDRLIDQGLEPATAHALWLHSRNFVLAGFESDAALAWTWALTPGVVIDLDYAVPGQSPIDRAGLETFADLTLLNAFTTYNHRCGYPVRFESVDFAQAVEQAEFGLIYGVGVEQALTLLPAHRLVRTLEIDGVPLQITTTRRGAVTPFRWLYGQRFIRQGQWRGDAELNPVFFDMLSVLVFGGYAEQVPQLLELFPLNWQPGQERRNIYFLGGLGGLYQQVAAIYEQVLENQKRPVEREGVSGPDGPTP